MSGICRLVAVMLLGLYPLPALHALTFHSFMGAEDGRMYATTTDGALMFLWHLSQDNTPVWANGSNGVAISSGWPTSRQTFYGGNGIIYAAAADGTLYFYRDLAGDGTVSWANGGIGAPIASGWNGYKWILGDGDGVIYSIDTNGAFFFSRDLSTNGQPMWANGGNLQQIGSGWVDYREVFSGRAGMVFGVKNDGNLYYFRDLARDGTSDWENGGQGLLIGSGWDHFAHLFSTGNGRIYAVDGGGRLYFYHVTINGTSFVWDYGGVGQQINSGFNPEYLEGYCWPLSGSAGDVLNFCVSGGGGAKATIFRHIADASGISNIPMGSRPFVPTVQPVPSDPVTNGCGWATSFSLAIPEDWPSGMYSAQLVSYGGSRITHINFIVKPTYKARSQVAVLANVNTWLAYNDWGGSSKYSGRAHVSFLRPNPGASPIYGDLHLARGELWILGWLEQQGVKPDLYTDLDFHNGIDLSSYKCLVIGTHSEYWTLDMYNRLQDYLKDGGSLLDLGGNMIFEEGEYSTDQTGMTFLAGVENGDRSVAWFRNLTPPKPEAALLGVGHDPSTYYTGAPYEVLQPSHPFFAGTGLTLGSTFGATGLNTQFGGGGASGWEMDNVDGPGVPPGITVLATGQNIALNGRVRGADMTYYPHPGGGFVFSVGSIQFGGSLVVDSSIQQIVRNALNQSLAQSNVPPVVAPVTDQNIPENVPFALTLKATDYNSPPQMLTWSLISGPAGLTLSSDGLISWTPDQTESPSTNKVVTRVTSNGNPHLSATNSFTIVVREVNVAPVLPAIAPQSINALALLTVTNTATESNLHASLEYALLEAPAGAAIDTNGIITWTPTRLQGPGTNVITTVVTNTDSFDNVNPFLSATNSFTVVVYAPCLAPISNYMVEVGQTVAFTNSATDNDASQTLSFALKAAPAGAEVTPDGGIFTWRASAELAGTSNYVQVMVTDNGVPPLNDTQAFTILVKELASVILTPVNYTNGHFTFSIAGSTGPDYILQASDSLANWINLATNTPTALPYTFTDARILSSNQFYRILLGP